MENLEFTLDEIKSIFDNLNIEITEIKKASNSYSSAVYLINKDKYVLKSNKRTDKVEVESKYIEYLSDYIPTSELVSKGEINGKPFFVMTFVSGVNKDDSEANNLTDKNYKEIGKLLATIHNTPLLEETIEWTTYLGNTLEKTHSELDKLFGEDNTKLYNYMKDYIENNIKNNYDKSILHMDFRIGNLMFQEDETVKLIDMESMKNGENTFDLVKIRRLLTKEHFNLLIEGYKEVKELKENFIERLDFYTLFDSYSCVYWCIANNQTTSEFYKNNYETVVKYLEEIK